MKPRIAGVASTWAIALLAAALAVVAAQGASEFGSLAAIVPALRLDFGVTPLAAPFLALLAMLGVAVGAACLKRERPVDAVLIAGFMAAMLFVLIARSIAAFFLAWETMSLASAFLVAANHKRRDVRRATFVYLVVAQTGAACLLMALVLLGVHAGDASFAAIARASASLPAPVRAGAFVLSLIGFGSKAGLLPLHFWLPRAHPVAPPSASALLSGAMLKVALYGLCVVVFALAAPGPAWWGIALISLGTISAVAGVLYALVEHDLKRLLAYHSVENIGIITIGIGLGLLAQASGNLTLAALGLVAALFHTINHGLFKALLFLGAGSVADAEGTVDLERLGGLWSRLVWTAPFFLIGCAAIVGLPPFNGFASEWMTFQGLIGGFAAADPTARLVVFAAIVGLALTGGLAAACFVKVFGVVFLGRSRRVEERALVRERFDAATFGLGFLAVLCTLFGIVPSLATIPLGRIAAATLDMPPPVLPALPFLPAMLVALPLAGALAALAIAARRGVRAVPTWTCGSPVTRAAQYSATAFSKPLRTIFAFVLLPDRRRVVEAGSSPWFPERILYQTESRDVIDEMARRFGAIMLQAARSSRALQSGSLRLYLAYMVTALVVVVALARR